MASSSFSSEPLAASHGQEQNAGGINESPENINADLTRILGLLNRYPAKHDMNLRLVQSRVLAAAVPKPPAVPPKPPAQPPSCTHVHSFLRQSQATAPPPRLPDEQVGFRPARFFGLARMQQVFGQPPTQRRPTSLQLVFGQRLPQPKRVPEPAPSLRVRRVRMRGSVASASDAVAEVSDEGWGSTVFRSTVFRIF